MNCARCRVLRVLEVGGAARRPFTPRKFERWRPAQLSPFSSSTRLQRTGNAADDDPAWVSVVDREPVFVRMKSGHSAGIFGLALIPLIAFALGTWQVQRLKWKTDLIARYEDQLIRPPLPLPPQIDISTIPSFDFRRVYAIGRYRHDQEMLLGPRMRDGEVGYIVITPFERGGGASTILISRGWIAKAKKEQKNRDKGALPTGEVAVEGLMREPPKKNYFTPDNNPDKGEFYFPDIKQMAELTGSQAVYIEETMELELFETLRRTERGIPMGRSPSVNLSNNHSQYIFTWYALSAATSIMFWMVFKKKPGRTGGPVRKSSEW